MKRRKTTPLAADVRQLEDCEGRFSLPAYLLSHQYQQISPRLFVKEKSPEILRVTCRRGKTYYRNFLIPADRGTALDFLCHRSHTEGAIVPNQELSCIERALTTALAFMGGQQLVPWKHARRHVASAVSKAALSF